MFAGCGHRMSKATGAKRLVVLSTTGNLFTCPVPSRAELEDKPLQPSKAGLQAEVKVPPNAKTCKLPCSYHHVGRICGKSGELCLGFSRPTSDSLVPYPVEMYFGSLLLLND